MLYRTARKCATFLHRNCKSKSLKPTSSATWSSSTPSSPVVQESHTKDHLTRTKSSFRQEGMLPATVLDANKLSPDVKGVKLRVNNDHSSGGFKAGQWIDLFIPGVSTVGGFSICSSPAEFVRDGTIELAVKYSSHPPAEWIHKKCSPGAEVNIRFGGDYFYDPPRGEKENLLLIAGGVGINPVYSILRHRRDLLRDQDMHTPGEQGATSLLYSARNLEEMIFLQEIQAICNSMPRAECRLFLTQADIHTNFAHVDSMHHERITQHSLEDVLQFFDQPPVSYICGPPGFIDKMEEYLKELGLSSANIKHEKWW